MTRSNQAGFLVLTMGIKIVTGLLMVVPTFNPRTQEAEACDFYEFKASLVYRVSSRTGSKATEKPCLEKQNKQTKKDDSCV